MSIVQINALTVPEGMGPVLEQRFAARKGAVDGSPGFEGFELLRPASGTDRYLVVTRWASQEAFEAWRTSQAFQQGHGQSSSDDEEGSQNKAHASERQQGQAPAATGSELWGFEVVDFEAVAPPA